MNWDGVFDWIGIYFSCSDRDRFYFQSKVCLTKRQLKQAIDKIFSEKGSGNEGRNEKKTRVKKLLVLIDCFVLRSR